MNNNFKRFKKQRFSLTLMVAGFAVGFLLIAFAWAVLALWLLIETGLVVDTEFLIDALIVVLIFIGVSIVTAFGLVLIFGKFPLKPVNQIINEMNRLASGDFRARLHFGKILSKHKTFKEIEESFNELAEELENTEMLRSDFVNNFSHEFKTPIVSIAGLAKLVNKGNLSEEQKKEYLIAIEEESLRLATMATNVLNLTKVENQTILSDVTKFNLSEQIRTSVLLLESEWTKKNIELNIDFDEFEIQANEALLKQIWINLIDNAIKFSPSGEAVTVEIKELEKRYSVSVKNTGVTIPKEKIDNIFNKFYQADESHASKGNGIGLAIVKKIVDLHSGKVMVESENNETCFTVYLPKSQSKYKQIKHKNIEG